MYIDRFERNLWAAIFVFNQMHGEHHHACNPEEDDVKSSHQHIGWVEGFQILCWFRPTKGGECP